jgi:hypothetical protein
MNLKRAALVGRHATFTACAHVPCRVIAGPIDPSFAEIERHVFGTDWLAVCYIVTKTPDDMAVPATDWLASSNLEHQVIRRAEAVGLLSVRASVYHRPAGAGMRCTVQAKTDHRRSALNISSVANSALGEHCRHDTDGIRQCRPLTRMRCARSAPAGHKQDATPHKKAGLSSQFGRAPVDACHRRVSLLGRNRWRERRTSVNLRSTPVLFLVVVTAATFFAQWQWPSRRDYGRRHGT